MDYSVVFSVYAHLCGEVRHGYVGKTKIGTEGVETGAGAFHYGVSDVGCSEYAFLPRFRRFIMTRTDGICVWLATLALLNAVPSINVELSAWYLTATVLSLPLSSLWAATAQDGSYTAAAGSTANRPMLGGGMFNSLSWKGTKSWFSSTTDSETRSGSVLVSPGKKRMGDVEMGKFVGGGHGVV